MEEIPSSEAVPQFEQLSFLKIDSPGHINIFHQDQYSNNPLDMDIIFQYFAKTQTEVAGLRTYQMSSS